jgi:hypothetical protein
LPTDWGASLETVADRRCAIHSPAPMMDGVLRHAESRHVET